MWWEPWNFKQGLAGSDCLTGWCWLGMQNGLGAGWMQEKMGAGYPHPVPPKKHFPKPQLLDGTSLVRYIPMALDLECAGRPS